MNANWKQVPGTAYNVSDDGQIFSELTNSLLTTFNDSRGYLQFYIYENGDRRLGRVHRLVAQAFVENPEGLLVVNHKDCNKQNNSYTNLEWTTTQGNAIHASDNGLLARGETSHLHVLKEVEVLEIIALLEEGLRDTEISRCFNVAHNTVADIRSGRTWRHVVRSPLSKLGPIKKLVGEDIPKIRELFLEGFRDVDIAKQYAVATATINQIRHGRTWKNY